jgi:ribonuclease-3
VDPADWLQQRLGCRFADNGLLIRALTHRSVGSDNNERLEYLGDAVLSFVVADMLFEAHPEASEGELSRYRASLVSGDALGAVALELGLGELLNLGDGERKSGGKWRASILADALEALIGAVYLDQGLDAARAVAGRLLQQRLAELPGACELKDAKTRLQEWLQGRGLGLPEYKVLEISGEPHEQLFRIRCDIGELAIAAEAQGSSRRRAEQEAASLVLKNPALRAPR